MTQTQRRSHIKMEAEMGGTKGCLEPQKLKEEEEPSPGASGGSSALKHLDFGFVGSGTVKQAVAVL